MKPLAIDLFCGLGGWTEGLLAEGYFVVGFDIERHAYGDSKYPAQLVIQDVLTLHGSQFKNAALIVASPPCQEYSYMAMPWSRAKKIAAEYRSGKRDVKQLTALFDACFRIQHEASVAAGHHIPMVVENVRGAIPWVGRSRWNFGSFHLWGDVPALMPMVIKRHAKVGGIEFNGYGTPGYKGQSFNTTAEQRLREEGAKNPGFRFDGSGRSMQTESVKRHVEGRKHGGDCFNDPTWPGKQGGVRRISEAHRSKCPAKGYGSVNEQTGVKQGGISGPRLNGKGDAWFQDGAARHGSKSSARKAASAMIAKIPFVLSQHIARVYKPEAVA